MVYIQSNTTETLPHHGDAASALYGVIDLVMDYKLISYENMDLINHSIIIKNNLFVGSTEFMSVVFEKFGKVPKLPMNCHRPHQIMTLKQVRNDVSKGQIYFVKPFQIKLFTGLIIDQISIKCLHEYSEDLNVMVYDVLPKILSEWRLYIHYNQIVDAKNYSGDFKIMPDWNYTDKQVLENRSKFPCAYTMDVGILDTGETTVIEYNDMWAIGNYGIPNDTYVKMLKDRYFDIIR